MKQETKPQIQLFIIHGFGDKQFANTFGAALEAAATMYNQQVAAIITVEDESSEDYDVQPVIDRIEIKIDASICVYKGSETRTTHNIF